MNKNPVWMRVLRDNPEGKLDFLTHIATEEKLFLEDLLNSPTWDVFLARKEKVLYLRSLLNRFSAEERENLALAEYNRRTRQTKGNA